VNCNYSNKHYSESWGSSVGTAGVWFSVGTRDLFLFSIASRPALGPNQPLFSVVQVGSFHDDTSRNARTYFVFFFSSDFMSGSLQSPWSFKTQITEEDLFYKHVRLSSHISWWFHVIGRKYGQMGHLQIHTYNYRGHVLIGATLMERDAFSLLCRISVWSPLATYGSRHPFVIQSADIKTWPPITSMLSQTTD
jgi:hypothetical protein